MVNFENSKVKVIYSDTCVQCSHDMTMANHCSGLGATEANNTIIGIHKGINMVEKGAGRGTQESPSPPCSSDEI